jgi:palmitoyl-protein thioesterase
MWLAGNPFLAAASNINSCTPSDKDCAKAKQRRRSNFLKLHAAHFFGSPQDDFIAPWQSSILGHYTDVGTTEQIETSFSSFKVLTMQQTPEYKQDTYGLKTLAARGGIFLHEAPNVGHSCWIHDYTTFDGKLDCKFQPVYDQYVYPVLRFPFCG